MNKFISIYTKDKYYLILKITEYIREEDAPDRICRLPFPFRLKIDRNFRNEISQKRKGTRGNRINFESSWIKSKVVFRWREINRVEGEEGLLFRNGERRRGSSGHRVDFELAGRGECLPARFECETPIVALFNRQPFETETPSNPENCLLCTLL